MTSPLRGYECTLGRSIHAAQIARFGRKQAIRPAARLVDHSGGYTSAEVDRTLITECH